jgi:beta-lactamase class A
MLLRFLYLADMRLALLFTLFAGSALAQQPLTQQIRNIAADAHGKVSVACSLPGSSLNCDLDPKAHPPMQSVFKLPLALTVLHQVELGKLSLDQSVRFLPEDRILPHAYSPLQDKYPEAGVDVPLPELLRLAVSLSDNVAADILLRIAGGPSVVNDYIASLGIAGFHLQDGERALHHEVALQYRNWFEPAGAVQLLRKISDNSPLTPQHTDLLLNWMEATRTVRLKGNLPNGTRVAHKSGTSDVDNGVAHATNDIGLIALPDGRRLAIAVFVTDSTADETTREGVIARIARAAYDAAIQAPSSSPSATTSPRPIPAVLYVTVKAPLNRSQRPPSPPRSAGS